MDTVIKVAQHDPRRRRRLGYVKYRITLKDGDPAQIIPADSRQTVTPEGSRQLGDPGSQERGATGRRARAAEVDPQYLKPNALVTSEDARVRSLARAGDRGVDRSLAKSRPHQPLGLSRMSNDKNFTVAFAAANEVARNFSGDCTEHAVLAAAMCRAAGIPSRVVDRPGLCRDELDGFGYHMWDEVYVNQRWVAIDPSWDQTTVDAAHIKLSDSSLDGVAPFEAFLPLIRVMGKLEIEPIELR